jgi:hypothetical protein
VSLIASESGFVSIETASGTRTIGPQQLRRNFLSTRAARRARMIGGIVHVLKSAVRSIDASPDYGSKKTFNNRYVR